ncbi:N-acetyltransferase [Glaciecola sp. KUL10]|uniref:GNAT family N-acetyltransferase n=1 Tax=Glaciecola sp. (strain KUL10) TaxID=2161813 RepID=UPI000D78B660|nr:GNAT family N-acetyltransferase [Glaciecola sp. KUL10]GBL06204.1 N-acetyltransferase GCN5 [Glaciecola sp. KUL10]
MHINVERVNYQNETQCEQLIDLLESYALDPMGGDTPLADVVKKNLCQALQVRAYMKSFICYVDDKPAGFANCIESFSTFNCKPVLNIHDFAVKPEFRGLQLSQHLMMAIEAHAKEIGCCKLTLEVLEGNKVAQNAYLKSGFVGYELNPEMGKAMFWEKKL